MLVLCDDHWRLDTILQRGEGKGRGKEGKGRGREGKEGEGRGWEGMGGGGEGRQRGGEGILSQRVNVVTLELKS